MLLDVSRGIKCPKVSGKVSGALRQLYEEFLKSFFQWTRHQVPRDVFRRPCVGFPGTFCRVAPLGMSLWDLSQQHLQQHTCSCDDGCCIVVGELWWFQNSLVTFSTSISVIFFWRNGFGLQHVRNLSLFLRCTQASTTALCLQLSRCVMRVPTP